MRAQTHALKQKSRALFDWHYVLVESRRAYRLACILFWSILMYFAFQRYVVESGLEPSVGYWAFAMVGIFNIVGSMSSGWAASRFPKRWVLSFIYGSRSLVTLVFIMTPVTPFSAFAFGILAQCCCEDVDARVSEDGAEDTENARAIAVVNDDVVALGAQVETAAVDADDARALAEERAGHAGALIAAASGDFDEFREIGGCRETAFRQAQAHVFSDAGRIHQQLKLGVFHAHKPVGRIHGYCLRKCKTYTAKKEYKRYYFFHVCMIAHCDIQQEIR